MSTRTDAKTTSPLGVGRLLVVVTGAAHSVHVPYWLTWLRSTHPDVQVRAVVTRSALRFVTEQAVAALTSNPVTLDRWPDAVGTTAPHVELAEWPDAVVVYPATLHYVSRLALGLADTPSLLALHGMGVPIALAPSLAPGIEDGPMFRGHRRLLEQRPNVVVAGTQPARSMTTGRHDARGALPLPKILEKLEETREKLRVNGARNAGHDSVEEVE